MDNQIKTITMVIAMAGASGTGKTTLANWIATKYDWKFISQSAGEILLPDDRKRLQIHYGYDGNWGQRNVINMSHVQPGFGLEFQYNLLRAREKFVGNAQDDFDLNFIMDRSALDILVYYLNQVVHNENDRETEVMIDNVLRVMRGYDLIIRLPLLCFDKKEDRIEDNGSRIANWYFQRKIDVLFSLAWDMIARRNHHTNNLPAMLLVDVWNWDHRRSKVEKYIENLLEKNKTKNTI